MKSKTNRPKFHVFNGKKYNIVWKKPNKEALGLCESPELPMKMRKIHIAPSLDPETKMEVLIHEGLHAELWCLDEDTVDRIGKNLAALLWKCGYRLTD